MTTPTEERPLVTFALFAYNQEKYIREAVEGALSQTYEPLEIILSDDCSTDRTFDIMQEMAAAYTGPHRVYTRKNEQNKGLIGHVCAVSEVLNGKFTVLAAGDDRSLPERVETLVRIWSNKYSGVFSAYDLIGPNGEVIKSGQIPPDDARSRFPWLNSFSSSKFVYGSTSSYDTRILKMLPNAEYKVMSEDTPLNLIVHLVAGEIGFSDESLVLYRVHSETLSNSMSLEANFSKIIASEEMQKIKNNREAVILTYILNILLPIFNDSSKKVDACALNSMIKDLSLKEKWFEFPFFRKISVMFAASGDLRKWMVFRVFGVRFYALLKYINLLLLGQRNARWEK